MFEKRGLSVARTIVTEEYTKIKAINGSVAEAQMAIFNRLKAEGLQDLAEVLILYHTSLMDVQPPKGNVNVTITNSTVGSVAFDSEISNINTAVNTLAQKGGESADFANALKKLSDAVTASGELTDDQKKGLLESLELVGQQAQEIPEKRKKTIVQSVLDNLPKALGVASSLASLWHSVGPHILNFFK